MSATKTALSSTASAPAIAPNQPISRKAKQQIELLLKGVPRAMHRWSTKTKAALLAGILAGIELAYRLAEEFHITGKIKSEWGKNRSIQTHFRTLVTA